MTFTCWRVHLLPPSVSHSLLPDPEPCHFPEAGGSFWRQGHAMESSCLPVVGAATSESSNATTAPKSETLGGGGHWV